jgi:exodeoxyribonuclease-5
LGRDLLSFGTRVLVLGDPAQLPPIKDGGFFTGHEPDVMLTEVHRQALDNPIIHLSMLARGGSPLPRGTFGESRVISRRDVDHDAVLDADQVLVGMNKTRRACNTRIRQLNGFEDPYPMAGEKLVCLRNDRGKGLLNGGSWIVERRRAPKMDWLRMDVRAEDDPQRAGVQISVQKAFFDGTEDALPYAVRRESDEFTYGYALTVHKAQGSQWDNVLLFDESFAFREHRFRWLYTGLTRAAETITVVD